MTEKNFRILMIIITLILIIISYYFDNIFAVGYYFGLIIGALYTRYIFIK